MSEINPIRRLSRFDRRRVSARLGAGKGDLAHGTVSQVFGRMAAVFGYIFTPETADLEFSALPPHV